MRAPEPGFYEGVPEPVYRSWPFTSYSHLRLLRDRTPAHAYYALTHPDEQSPERALGQATHMALLEPERFERTYRRTPPGLARNRKEAAEVWQAHGFEWAERKWQLLGPGEVLTHSDYEAVVGMRDAILRHETAAQLVLAPGKSEAAVVWDEHLPSGVMRCKARIDRLTMFQGRPVIVDLKTSSDARPSEVPWSIGKFRYHLQAAMYVRALAAQDALAAREVLKRRFVMLFVESDPPHLPVVYELDEHSAYEADAQLYGLMERWIECEQTGVWPGYPLGVQRVSLPERFWRKGED